jgi:hypothetical protein
LADAGVAAGGQQGGGAVLGLHPGAYTGSLHSST